MHFCQIRKNKKIVDWLSDYAKKYMDGLKNSKYKPYFKSDRHYNIDVAEIKKYYTTREEGYWLLKGG